MPATIGYAARVRNALASLVLLVASLAFLAGRAPGGHMQCVDTLMQQYEGHIPGAEAGTSWCYGNSGYALLR